MGVARDVFHVVDGTDGRVGFFEDTDDLRYNVDVDSLDVSAFGNSLYQFDYDLEDVEEA